MTALDPAPPATGLPAAPSKASIRRNQRLGRVLAFVVALVVTLFFAFPLYWMVVTALKGDAEIFRSPPTFVPHPAVWGNFMRSLSQIPFWDYVRNSLVYAVLSAVGASLSASIVAYGFSKVKWPGREAVFFLVLITMLLPYQVTMIPTYLIFRAIGWTGTLLPLIVPAFLGNAYFIFLMRQFIRTLPDELSDAARIDGAGEFRVFWTIILPLIKPALAVVFLNQFLNAWKDFLGPLLYLNDPSQYTLSLGLQQFQSANGQEWALLMACATVFTIPLFVLFFFTQRYFVEGVTFTGLKG